MTNRTPSSSVLYVGPQTDERAQRLAKLRSSDVSVQVVSTAMAALKRLDHVTLDCLVVSGRLSDMDTIRFRQLAHERQPAIPVLVVGPLETETSASRGMSIPIDYVPNDEALVETVTSVVQHERVDVALDHHRQLQETIRRIARDAIDTSPRETIEHHVYTHLADYERYQLVWLAEYDETAETLHLRVPTTGDIASAEFASLFGTDDPSFLTRAISNRDVAVAESTATIRRSTPSPPENNNNGDQAADTSTPPSTMAVVPFVHTETVHGLLLVLTTRSAIVDETEQELLADLGRIIGYVLDRIQSEEPSEAPDPEAFANMVVHELTNPLNVAQGYLEMVQAGDTDRLDAVDRALNQIEHVLTDELALLRGQEIGEMTDRELADAADEAWASVVTGDAELVIDDSAPLRADQALLMRLLANLFDNAVTHGGEEVTVHVGMLESEPGFYVEDDGPGIPDDEQRRIFGQGYTTGGGTGLGLAIVQRIADAHGWEITVTDSQTGGVRFEITGIEAGH